MNEHQNPQEAHEPRLLDLLHDLVDELGPGRVAAQLRVDRKTLWRVLNTGRLTPRLMRTLERRERAAGQDAARHRERGSALERRVAALERELPARMDALRTEFEALTSAQTEALQAWERRLPAVESPQAEGDQAEGDQAERNQAVPSSEPETDTVDVPAQARAVAPPPVKGVPQPVIGAKPRVRPPWRAHPEVITPEAAEGEELVYGVATPLIVEWRQARGAFLDKGGSRVERASGWVRMCELALVLVGEHQLTLPPETYPWDEFRHDRELWEGAQSLRDARRERRRALCWRFLRRVLTLGLWRR